MEHSTEGEQTCSTTGFPRSLIVCARACSYLTDRVEQIECFSFERLIRIFETFDDDHLMLRCILAVDLHDAGQSVHTQILEIVIVA